MQNEHPKVIGLIRVSTKGQAEDDRGGIPRQKEVIRQIVAAKKLTLVDTIEVNDVSGTEVRHCPEIMGILAKLHDQTIQGIVVADFDRFMRPDSLGKIGLLDIFEETKSLLYFNGGEIDFSTDSGFLTAGFQALIAGNEIRTFKRRVQGAKEELRKQGKCPNSAITFPKGVTYNRPEGVWEYTTDIAIVQEAFRLVDEEHITNYHELERRTGIHHRALHNTLRNPIYIGIRFIDKKRSAVKNPSKNGRQADRKKISRLPHEIINVRVIDKPAVDPDRFERVQGIIKGIRKCWSSSRINPSTRLLTGVGRCGQCGSLLYGTSGGGKVRQKPAYYLCKKNWYLFRKTSGGCEMGNIRQDLTDQAVISWVAEKLSDKGILEGIADNHLSNQESSSAVTVASVADLDKELESIEKKKNRLHKGWLDGRFTDKEHDDLLKELTDEKSRLSSLSSRTSYPEKTEVEKRLLLLVKGALAFARIQDRMKQKTVIQQLFDEIHISNDGIKGFKIKPQFNVSVCNEGIHTGRGSSPPQA